MTDPGKVMFLSFFAHMVNDGIEFVLPILLPLIAVDFNLSYSQIGVLGGSMIVTLGFGQMFMGYLSDLTGKRKKFISSGLCLLSVGLYGISISASYGELIFFNLIVGLGASVYHPVGVSTIAEIFKDDRKGRALGIHGAGGNIGMCLFPLVSGILAYYFGWRIVFVIFPFFSLAISLLFFIFVAEPLKRVKKSRLNLTMNRSLMMIALSMGFITMASRGMAVFFPIRLDSIGYPPYYIGILFSIFFGAGIFGQYAGGYLSDTYSKRRMIMFLSMASGVLLFIPFFVSSFYFIAVIMVFAGFIRDSIWPPFFSLFTDNAPEKFHGLSLGIFFSTGYLMSSQAPVIMGILWDNFSFFASTSLLLILGVAASLSIKRV